MRTIKSDMSPQDVIPREFCSDWGVFGANQLWWGLWNRTEVLCHVLGREDADQRVDGTLLPQKCVPRGRGGLEMEVLRPGGGKLALQEEMQAPPWSRPTGS